MAKTAMVVSKKKKKYQLLFMALPFMLMVFLFSYVPIFGWIYSVYDYIPGVALPDCDFMGLEYFRLIFKDANILRTLKNTMIFAVIGIFLTPLPMVFWKTLFTMRLGLRRM